MIDAWAQLPTSPETLPPVLQRLFEQSGQAELLKTGVDPDAVVEAMDRAGVDLLLVSAWHGPDGPIQDNDAVAEIVARHPDRMRGVAAVDLARPVQAVRELERAVTELGFVALRVVPWLWSAPPNDARYFPLYVKCVELGVPFCTQVGHTGPLMPSEPGRPVPYLDEVALTFPELVIVGGHIGYPWTEEMVGLAWKHANVHIDTSAWLPRYYPAALLQFMRSYGRDKVLWGTNFPMLDIEKCAAQAGELELPEPARERFLRGNARRVFGL